MTVEADAHGDLSVVSKAEIEDDCGLDMSSYQDLPNGGGGDCNGVLHDERQEEEGIVANGKDDADSSYVFVSGTDAVADDPHTRDLNAECVEESNVGSPKEEEEEEEEEEEIDVRVGESEVDNGENLQSHVEDNCIVEGTVIAPSNNDVAFTSSQDNVQSHVEDNCIVEGTVVAPSDNDVALEGPPCESNGDEEGRSDVVEEQNETVAVESEPQQIDSEVKVEEQIKLESSSKLEDTQESLIIVLEEAGCELPELDDGNVKDEEQNILESIPEVERSRESQLKIPKPAESELNDDEEEEVEGESKSDSAIDMKENHEPANMVSEDVRLELDQEKEAAKSADGIAAEGPPGDRGLDKESDLEMSTSPCPGTYIQLETEVGNDSASDENGNSLLICHVEDGIPETQVINDLVAGSQNTHELDGSSKNAESLPLSVDCVRPEIEVGDVSFESSEGLPSGPDSDSVVEPDVGTGASLITENSPSSAIGDMRSTNEVEKFDAKSGKSVLSCPVDDAKSEIEVENGPVEGHGMPSFPDNDARSEPESGFNSINCEEKVITLPREDVNIESDVSSGIIECACSEPIPVLDIETHVNDLVVNESSLPNCADDDMKSESEIENAVASSSRDIPSNDATVSGFEVLNGSVVDSGSTLHCVPEVVDVEKEGDQSTTGDSVDKQECQENKLIEEIDKDETATSSPEGSSADALDGQNVSTEVGRMPFYFLIRIPRYDDENLREQIKHAQLQVDEKTQIRDAIRVEVQTKRAACRKYSDNFEAAMLEGKTARELLKTKRKEMDSVQSVINRMKDADSVEDIDGRIRNMEHMIEHETLPLKEEKQFIREIKQLKQHREQLSSSMGRQDEVQQALDQRDQIEGRLKSLKKEADLLRENVLKAEAVTKAAKKKYFEETEKVNEFQAKFKAADDIRQEAYSHLQNLRKQLSEKNKYFRMYKDDEKAANDFALNGDREALQHLCVNQVETIMELWNKNDEFRKDYLRCNIRSTLRRLRTLDGRSLGPDEEPPILPKFVNGRVIKKSLYAPSEDNSVSVIATLEQENLQPVEAKKVDDKPMAKVVEQKNQTAKTKKPTKPAPLGNGSATVSGRDVTEEAKEEERKQTKEEEELARKAEELRKEVEAAKLKEQRRLEEKAKAKEALERKKRNIEKAQARAELRAQKEAEQKEKEREKKVRKKERKKGVAAEATNGSNEGDSAQSSETQTETMKESEIIEKPAAVTKRAQKSSQFTKLNKAKAIPLPLRNKGKRRLQPWMWVLLTALLVLAVFLVGNSGFSFDLGLLSFGSGY